MRMVAAIDPGREKCGLAVVAENEGVLWKQVIETAQLEQEMTALLARYRPEAVVMGNGTSSKKARQALEKLLAADGLSLQIAEEYRTTDLARRRYWQDNAPRGWRRFWPTSLQVPPTPVDDYAAVILAERYLGKSTV